MSRSAFGELVGLTPTQVNNLENGRSIRPQEAEKLRPLIEDYLARSGGTVPPAAPGDAVATPAPSEPGAATEYLDTPEAAAAGQADLNGMLAPVVLLTPEEYEEEGIPFGEEEVVVPGSGIVPQYDFQLEGYHLSNSELSKFRRCLRKWWFEYYRELRFKEPNVTGARAIGTRLHLALAAYYSTRRDDPMQVLEDTVKFDAETILTRVDPVRRDEKLADLEKDADLCRAMLEGYLDWVQETGEDAYLQVVGDEVVVEQELAEILGQKVILVGKLDLRLTRTIDNARLFLDHKSVGSFAQARKMLPLDTQMMHYGLLEYLDMLSTGMGENEVAQMRTTSGLYNMLRKVKRTKTANPPFFERVEVPQSIVTIQSYRQRVLGEAEDIINLRAILDGGADPKQVAYPNPMANRCEWDCDFFLVCPMVDDGSRVEDFLTNFYEQANPHDHYLPYGEQGLVDA